ncbi:MAG TPA: methionyl-tRNA formyltransferase [Acidobacteriaceae bacterium]|nr:methionyl-tRNA formyltransferase [Acidobacteriaceae bacterium]
MRLVFCGTPQFAVPTLDALLQAGHRLRLVLSQPDRTSGRGMEVQISPVKRYAEQHGLAIAQPEKLRHNAELQEQLRALDPDAIVIVAYGRLIPPWMLSLPKHGNLNVHASLLPKYRGAAPIQWAVANGETETGVTTMRIDEGLDTGDILLQERVPIMPRQTAVELSPVLSEVGAKLMVRTLAGLEQGTLAPTPQDHLGATLAPILQREDGRIDWSWTAQRIYDRWRGFQPWPGAFTSFHGKKWILHAMQVVADPAGLSGAPGTLVRKANRLLVACGEGTWLDLLELQMEGKRRMAVEAFLNGLSFNDGERLDPR